MRRGRTPPTHDIYQRIYQWKKYISNYW